MQLSFYCSLATALACLLVVRDIDCLPTQVAPNSNVNNEHEKSRGSLMQNSQNQNIDQDVQELENLKPAGNSMSVMKSHSSVFTDINGKKEGHSEIKEEVNKDGKLLARVDQKVKQQDDGSAPTPLTFIRTEVEIPHRGIHRVIESPQSSMGGGNGASPINTTTKRKLFYPRVDADEFNMDSYPTNIGIQFSPLDMAEYIFWTGDDKGVTLAIEEFLVEGLMSREGAISYLHDIKSNLDYLYKQYTEEQNQHENVAKEQTINSLRKNLGFLEKARQVHNDASELMEVRQQMRDNINKKSIESVDPESLQLKQRLMQAGSQGITDDDYEDLLERLRVADFLYTEYSLEEVIYQLAKVMFSQSLTRGSSEAQEALEKFTRFLETEAEMGRISRTLEKKVLDVLIAGLTDTLTEHPELVQVARESLGGPPSGSNSINDQLLQQLLILNPSALDKTDSIKENAMKLEKLKNHRFMMTNKNPNTESLPIMKKSTTTGGNSASVKQNGNSLQKNM